MDAGARSGSFRRQHDASRAPLTTNHPLDPTKEDSGRRLPLNAMGWLWSSSKAPDGDKSSSSSETKDFSNLDRSLEEYLKSSTPQDIQPTAPVPEIEKPVLKVVSQVEKSKPRESVAREYGEQPAPHSQSAYGDRYADYWASYKGPDANKIDSPDVRIKEYLAGYKQMVKDMKAAAAENCSIEEIELHHCYNHGSMWQKMRMCTEENQRLSKCITQQTEFLKALGYLADPWRDPALTEKMQMHADRLYRQQQALDAATKSAVKEGRSVEEAVARIKADFASQSAARNPTNEQSS
ncbi:hypothetical protein Dda_8642 [Drechslerella dactyloides]|uniref:Uncharacterized protein n=1 Tax=Drechslerella dactyloides TaxID=74499 RepID=A0AAD6IQQ1_DREDA|nr:hypothetical protein Dda_8642 [Drechslerella dactyloides]